MMSSSNGRKRILRKTDMLILNVTLECSNCGSELVTETTNTSDVVKVQPVHAAVTVYCVVGLGLI